MSPEITAYFGYLNDSKRRLDTLRPSKGRGNRFTTTAKRIIIEATLRGRDLNLSDTEVANRLGVSKTAVNRLTGKRDTYATPRVNEYPHKDLTSKAQLAVEVARQSTSDADEIEERAVNLMQFSEPRLRELLKSSTSVLKITTREGYTIEGLSLEQVVELIKVQ